MSPRIKKEAKFNLFSLVPTRLLGDAPKPKERVWAFDLFKCFQAGKLDCLVNGIYLNPYENHKYKKLAYFKGYLEGSRERAEITNID